MTKDYPHNELERFVDGDCSREEAARIEADIARDPSLANEVEKLERLNRAIRQTALSIEAPQSLRDATENRYLGNANDDQDAAVSSAAPSRLLNRRAMLAGTGGVLAAGLATVAILPRLDDASPVDTFFHDYETFLLKDRALDVTETDMVRLAGWFGDRLPFKLPPFSSSAKNVKLVGGRLCWLLERRLASLSYDTAQGPVVLYIMNANGIDLPKGQDKPEIGKEVSWHRSSEHACLMWSSDDLLFCMVGAQDVHNLMSIARVISS